MILLTWQELINMDRDVWVSVSESLPPCGMEVLVYLPNKDEPSPGYTYHHVTALSRRIPYEGAKEYSWDNSYPGKGNCHLSKSVTYWKPLPRGPQLEKGK